MAHDLAARGRFLPAACVAIVASGRHISRTMAGAARGSKAGQLMVDGDAHWKRAVHCLETQEVSRQFQEQQEKIHCHGSMSVIIFERPLMMEKHSDKI